MKKRIRFNSEKSRDKYFRVVLAENKLYSWKDISLKFRIPRAMLSKYRIGKLTLPMALYERLSSNFNSYDKNNLLKETTILEDNWGSVKGGKITYSKNKLAFEEGRKKGIIKIKSNVHHFDINLKLDTRLAYFIGLFIAEGFTNNYMRYYITQLVGHRTEEKKYYSDFIKLLAINLFGLVPTIRDELKSNAIRFNLYSKDLFEMITKRFKISRGRKSYTVLIPDEIVNADKNILFACISGIYDGEACFFVDKRNIYHKPYPRIDLHMVNPALIKQIYEILVKEGINCSISGKYVRIYIYGDKNILDFLDKVGFQNPKHIHKITSYFGKEYTPKKLI